MLLLTLHICLVVVFSIRILLRDDLEATSRLAWFVILIIFPYFGAGLYWLFGENNIGQAISKKYHAIFAEMRLNFPQLISTKQQNESQIDLPYRAAFAYAASINGFHTLPDNRAELMPDADQARARLLNDVEQAQHNIDILYYIWLADHTGIHLANALIRAAKRGVTCRVMVDGLGSRQFVRSSYWQQMQAAGVQLAIAFPIDHPLKTIITGRLDLRNHRKITLIDNKIVYCGSQNCADPEFRVKARFAPWVDILLRFEGAVVRQMQLLFTSDWLVATGKTALDELPSSKDSISDKDSIVEQISTNTSGFAAQVVGDGPTERKDSCPQLFVTLFHSAQHEIALSTPYFVPDHTTIEAICAAAWRGVKVSLIFPQRNDSWVVSAASRSHYYRLLQAGVAIYEFKNGLLHAKTLTIDGKVSYIGSTNLDLRSFNLNYENNILLQDNELTAAIYQRQQDYIAQSIAITQQQVGQWSVLRRIWQNIVATIGPIL
ncbi:cardiolipin synthase [Testudinibacter sp. TR-2022]|uniref:cardiolipin synthase n=1 Tax=Testudinibacter sp. TR-2022 TaxID=2585029 RepID=UPI00111B07F2|nr:cardiolipin synthase [Testudinibacter sp. TR-2022]TNH08926.1 cardiolipin synthase [Pasteurellaceae bacterium Phil11]TNH23468.1 cardiolipin synthase [Testudinibacter sp. TR-2022]TNH28728.1 cardiolipin synthase [Testudinibacter sp. TR-2022]